MNRVLCDPNYKPAELYLQIEALLLFYDQVLLYAPSQDQIQRAGLDWRRLQRLIAEGFVVPVGRKFWFDPKERDALARDFAGNPEKSATYRWSNLDDAILSVGPLSSLSAGPNSRGFLLVNDEHRQFADQVEQQLLEQKLPETRSREFGKLVDYATRLRETRRLPNELLHGPLADAAPERLAARLAFCAAGDTRLGQVVGASSIFSTREMGEVYRAVTRSIPSNPGPQARLTTINPRQEYNLSPDELEIASRLALHIVESDEIGQFDIDLLLRYRQTSCWMIFRDLVADKLAGLGPTHSATAEARLKSAFEIELDRIGKLSVWGPWGLGALVGVGGPFVVRELTQGKSVSRRGLFTLMAGLSFGLFGTLLPKVAMAASAEVVDSRYHTLFVLIAQQRARKAKRSGM